MPSSPDPISEEAARSIWRRAAQLQAEAERRLEESHRLPATTGREAVRGESLHPDDVRAAAEEAGISPEFVQIALAEASASPGPATVMSRSDMLGARLFLGATQRTLEATAVVEGDVDSVSAAVLQVFTGHPCLLQAGEVAELPSWSGRVIVFNVPKFDWSATANPPFVEKAAAIGQFLYTEKGFADVTLLPADVYARFKRAQGHEVLYICATDEHGTPAELAAAAAGQDVRTYCDEQHEIQKAAGEAVGLS